MAQVRPSVGVAIVNYNSGNLLARCLGGLRSADYRDVLDPVVVDNASSDSSLDHALQVWPGLRIHRNASNVGFAAAANEAVALAGGELVLLLNPDCFWGAGLERMVSFLVTHDRVAAVAPRLREVDGDLQPSCGYLPEPRNVLRSYFPMTRLFSLFGGSKPCLVDPGTITRPRAVGWVRGACMLVRRTIWHRTGGFDESFFFYGEEIEWCWRVAGAGWWIAYFPDAEATHVGGGSTRGEGALGGRLPYQHERSMLRLLSRVRGSRSTIPLRFAQATSAALLLFAHGLAVVIGRERLSVWSERFTITMRVLSLAFRCGSMVRYDEPAKSGSYPESPRSRVGGWRPHDGAETPKDRRRGRHTSSFDRKATQ